jgi:MFS family permease
VSVVVASYEGSKTVRRGWAVLIAAAIGILMTVPGQTVGVAPFVDHLAADLGIPREWVILTYSLGTLLGILPAPLFGRVLDRYGPRRVIGFVVVALSASCLAMAAVVNQIVIAGLLIFRHTFAGVYLGRPVADYRAYVLGKTGHILMRHEFESQDDAAALNHALRYVTDYDVEVWQLDRLVGTLQPKKSGR